MAVLAVAVATAAGRAFRSYRALDRVLLAQAAVTGLAALVGIGSKATTGLPADPLHLLYGALAALLPLAVRIWASGRTARSIARWVAGAAVVALGATVRSFMTGS